MAIISIEMDRGAGWEVRAGGTSDLPQEALIAELERYATQYPHRLLIDGKLIATAERPHGRRGKTQITIHAED